MDVLVGKTVRLRPMKDSDYEYFASLKNDLRTQAWNQRTPMCRTAQQMKEHYETERKKPHTGDFSIETLDGALVGTIGYGEDPPRLAAHVGVITGMEHWGKGYALEAHELLLRFLFEERGIQVVRLWTQSGNERGIAAAEKIGFKVQSRFRENGIIGGKPADNVYMDMLREEYFKARGLKDNLPPRR
ncbi:MAG: GNAT family protein [Methanobacteriota archaeon]